MKRCGVEVTNDHEDWVSFKTTCQCGAHSLSAFVERGSGTDGTEVLLFFECGRFDRGGAFWRRLLRRIRDAAQVLFTGRLRLEEEFIFRDGGHIEDFRDVLAEAASQIEKPEKAGSR